MFVSDIGEFGKRDGKVYVKRGRRWSVWASYLRDPKGLAFCRGVLYVADVDRVWAVKDRSAVFMMVGPKDFKAEFLNGMACGRGGKVLTSDTFGGMACGRGGKVLTSDTFGDAVYEIDPVRKTVKKHLHEAGKDTQVGR